MIVRSADFKGAERIFAGPKREQWLEVERSLTAILPHFKGSDQAGRQGSLIFDPVGTNLAIKACLTGLGWGSNIALPAAFSPFGLDVDFVHDSVLCEVQFSNYPFLLNNVVRTELLHIARAPMMGVAVDSLIMITKARMFPSSQSTLYFEQAVSQMNALEPLQLFRVPVRVVGLFCDVGQIDAVFTEYSSSRTSRTIADQRPIRAVVQAGRNPDGRHRITRA